MGTRNLIAVFYDGEYRIAQYGQWDGYPSGEGVGCLTFLKEQMNKELFLKQLKKLRWLTVFEEEMVNNDNDWKQKYPYLSRDMGSDILKYVQENDLPTGLDNRINFAHDSLFCEWAYVIDFDKNTFEVYGGFNQQKNKPKERFYKDWESENGYYSVKLLKSFDLDNLPTEKEFLNKLEKYE